MPDSSGAARAPGTSRPARRVASHSGRRRSALRKSAVRVSICGIALAALRWGVPYLRHSGALPHLPRSMSSVAVSVATGCLAVFMAAELVLLVAAIVTVRKPDAHRAFVNLMLWWPYALVMPYTIIRSRRLPQQFLLADPDRRHQQPDASVIGHPAYRKREPAEVAKHRVAPGPPGKEGTPGPETPALTPDEYRRALQLLLRHAHALQGDLDLLNLCLLHLTPAEEAERASAQQTKRRRIDNP